MINTLFVIYMISKQYVENAFSVGEFLMQHVNQCIMDDDVYKIAPLYGKRIIDDLEEADVFACTKDGIIFDTDDIPALFSFLSELKDSLPNESFKEIDNWLNRIKATTGICSDIINIGSTIIK